MSVDTIQLEDSKLYACVALQAEVFLAQSNELLKLKIESDKNVTVRKPTNEQDNTSNGVPDLLRRRSVRYTNISSLQNRKIDDIEILLLCILNADGKILLTSKMEDLVVLMTRMTKVSISNVCIFHI
jgi:hypothetical protein